jgi:hypothetical protein
MESLSLDCSSDVFAFIPILLRLEITQDVRVPCNKAEVIGGNNLGVPLYLCWDMGLSQSLNSGNQTIFEKIKSRSVTAIATSVQSHVPKTGTWA